jgi:glycerol-3-phosphate dehydrogenase
MGLPRRVSMPSPQSSRDVAIIGGGIAGLWLLNALVAHGYDALLFERSSLGDGQTIASQGMIHGGLKYALGGRLTPAADAIAGMPARWRRCLAGTGAMPGDVDLRGVPVLSDHYYLWSDDSALGRLGAFLASKVLRGRIERVKPAAYPPALAHPAFEGVVYRTPDLVLDVPALLARLAEPQATRIVRAPLAAGDVTADDEGAMVRVDGRWHHARRVIFAAGAGNEILLAGWPCEAPRMQRRPLHQVIVHEVGLPPLYAHWIANLSRAEPRLTITSHRRRDGRWCWYLGGQLANDGVSRTREDQIAAARTELAAALPWLELGALRLETLRIDRAEPQQSGGHRPDTAFVAPSGPALICWPTKLSLVPDLADRVLAALPPPRRAAARTSPVVCAPSPAVATPPWEH